MPPKVKKNGKRVDLKYQRKLSKNKRKMQIRIAGALRKVNRQVFGGDVSMSKEGALLIQTLLVENFLPKLNEAADRLRMHEGRRTTTADHIRRAARLILPKELASHAISEAHRANYKEQEFERNRSKKKAAA